MPSDPRHHRLDLVAGYAGITVTSDPGWELPSPDDAVPPPETIDWVQEQLGAQVQDIEPLYGGLSSAIHRLTLGARRVVLRRHTNASWMAREPYIPHHETRTLRLLATLDVGVDTPTLIAVDPDANHCDVPTIIMTEVAGRPELNPADPMRYAEHLASCLGSIHRVPVPNDLDAYRRWDSPEATVPVWVEDHHLWQAARDRIAGDLPAGIPAFLHRDFHPNNIHWLDGEICAVVDWLSACVGPVEADLAHCRWNLAMLFEPAVAEHFTARYLGLSGSGSAPDTNRDILTAYDLSVVLSAPIGPFPTHAWNSLGRADLTPETVPPRIESWLRYLMD